MIDNLNGYSKSVESHRSLAVDANSVNSHDGETPVDLSSFSSNLTQYKGELESKARGLAYRLEAARAANETGMTVTAPDGTISYYVPDGVEDNADNIKIHNNVETWAQAKADSETLVEYSEKGCTVEEWQALLARMQDGQGDPAYANTVTNSIGPERMLDCVVDIEDQFASVSHSQGTVTSECPGAGNDLAVVLGNILATASSTWPDEKVEDYANRMADGTQREGHPERIGVLNTILATSREIDVDGDGVDDSVGLDYSDKFLVTLGRRIEAYDYERVPADDRSLLVSSEIVGGDNPLRGVVHAMAGNPEAGLEWLVPTPAGPTTPAPVGEDDSMQYTQRIQQLIEKGALTDTQWTTDWARLGDQIDRNSEAPPLSLLPPDENKENFRRSASAAAVSGIVNGIGSGDAPPTMTDEGRNVLGNILARHPEGVDESTASAGNPGAPIKDVYDANAGTHEYYPVLTDRALTNLLGQISQNESASNTLNVAMDDYYNMRLQEGVSDYKETGTTDELQRAVTNRSAFHGAFAGAESHQNVVEGHSADEKTESGLNIIGGMTGVVGAVATEVFKPELVHEETDALKEGEDIKNAAISDNEQDVTLSLLNSGLYTSEDLKKSLWATGGSVGDEQKAAASALNVVDKDGNVLTNGITDPEQGGDGVQGGLRTMFPHLQSAENSELSFGEEASNAFNSGFESMGHNSPTPPSHEWDAEKRQG